VLIFGAHPNLKSQSFTQFQVKPGYHGTIGFSAYICQKGRKHLVISFK